MGVAPRVAGGVQLPAELVVNLALATYGRYEYNNNGTDIYTFCGYRSMLCYSKTGNGAVSTITRYDKAGQQLGGTDIFVDGKAVDVTGAYRVNIRLSNRDSGFFYGKATFAR